MTSFHEYLRDAAGNGRLLDGRRPGQLPAAGARGSGGPRGRSRGAAGRARRRCTSRAFGSGSRRPGGRSRAATRPRCAASKPPAPLAVTIVAEARRTTEVDEGEESGDRSVDRRSRGRYRPARVPARLCDLGAPGRPSRPADRRLQPGHDPGQPRLRPGLCRARAPEAVRRPSAQPVRARTRRCIRSWRKRFRA